VHGEEESARAFGGHLQSKLGFSSIEIPDMHQSFEI
jgi:hypothetical protein